MACSLLWVERRVTIGGAGAKIKLDRPADIDIGGEAGMMRPSATQAETGRA
jgi:hypothetical protein